MWSICVMSGCFWSEAGAVWAVATANPSAHAAKVIKKNGRILNRSRVPKGMFLLVPYRMIIEVYGLRVVPSTGIFA